MKSRFMLLTIVFICCSTLSWAESRLSENEMIAITPVVCNALDIPADAKKILDSKLMQIVTTNGLGSRSSRYTLTPNVVVLDKQMTTTAPSMIIVELEVSLYVVDIHEDVVIGVQSFTTKGVDTSEGRAYRRAISYLKTSSSEVKSFMDKCRNSIVDYYATVTPNLIKKADALAAIGHYDEALELLIDIPESVAQYEDVANKMVTIHNRQIRQQSQSKNQIGASEGVVEQQERDVKKVETVDNVESTVLDEARELRICAKESFSSSLSKFTDSVNKWYIKTLSQIV